jgi:hypothetical protein
LNLSSGGRPRPTVIDGSSHVVVVAVTLQRDVIPEPLCLLIGIRMAAHPGQQPREVGHFALSLIEGEELGHPQRNQSLPQNVLHRLPEPKVGAERDRGNELGEADSRRSGSTHGPSLEQRIRQASQHTTVHGNDSTTGAQPQTKTRATILPHILISALAAHSNVVSRAPR